VGDLGTWGLAFPDRDDVEPVAVSGSPKASPPDLGKTLEDQALAASHGLLRLAKAVRAPGFDFDEGDDLAAARYQIEVVAGQAEAMGLDPPPLPHQIPDCGALPLIPLTVARVGPCGHRLPNRSGTHAGYDSGLMSSGRTQNPQGGVKSRTLKPATIGRIPAT